MSLLIGFASRALTVFFGGGEGSEGCHAAYLSPTGPRVAACTRFVRRQVVSRSGEDQSAGSVVRSLFNALDRWCVCCLSYLLVQYTTTTSRGRHGTFKYTTSVHPKQKLSAEQPYPCAHLALATLQLHHDQDYSCKHAPPGCQGARAVMRPCLRRLWRFCAQMKIHNPGDSTVANVSMY